MIVFFVLAGTGIVSALLMVTRRNPVHGALFLILNFFALAGIYLTLSAQFIAIIQILVYAGAIMVLVLFVIMLLNLQDEKRLAERRTWANAVSLLLSACLLAVFLRPLAMLDTANYALSAKAAEIGTVRSIGEVLYTSFIFPFELASILLLAAIIGAVALAKKTFP
jgi:NADH-quinone oxidoreductase subunit J